jgi:hypothetical protein
MQLKFKSRFIKTRIEICNEYHLFVEDDFKTDNDLQLACLILDRQVKLINGNEANLLVPEEWLKKFIEDQAQGMQQSETSKPQILSTNSIFSRKNFHFH